MMFGLSLASLLGAAMIAVPLIVIAFLLLWWRHRPVFLFAFAAILVGTGYLVSTGAASDVAKQIAPGVLECLETEFGAFKKPSADSSATAPVETAPAQ